MIVAVQTAQELEKDLRSHKDHEHKYVQSHENRPL